MVLIKKPSDIQPSEITDESAYLNRRKFIQGAGLLAASTMLPVMSARADMRDTRKVLL